MMATEICTPPETSPQTGSGQARENTPWRFPVGVLTPTPRLGHPQSGLYADDVGHRNRQTS
eukprot:7258404-Pyramimonas_sp.AAC.1